MISKEVSNLVKSVSCIMIILHHFLLRTPEISFWISGFMRGSFGYIFVSVFFLLSGYGVVESVARCKTSLAKDLIRRIWKIYKPLLVVNIVMVFVYWMLGPKDLSLDFIQHYRINDAFVLLGSDKCNVTLTICYILGIKLIDNALWFVYVLLILYCILYISLWSKYRSCFLLFLCMVYFFILYWLFPEDKYIYASIYAFPLGCLLSLNKHLILKYLFFFYLFSFLSLLVSLCIQNNEFFYFAILISLVSIIIFITQLECDFTHCKVGDISYEMYLVHIKVFTIMIFLIGVVPFWIYLATTIIVALGIRRLVRLM